MTSIRCQSSGLTFAILGPTGLPKKPAKLTGLQHDVMT